MTNAPNSIDDVETSLIRLPGDIKTRSEVLSDSVMDGSALNEFQDSESGCVLTAVIFFLFHFHFVEYFDKSL